MANLYTFRVDELESTEVVEKDVDGNEVTRVIPGVTRESVVSFLSALGCKHVVCREISDVTKKPHYQGWVYLDLSKQTYANRIKKQWPIVCGAKRGRSSGHYSAAEVRKDTYKAYCLKGTPTEQPDVVSMQLAPFEELDIPAMHRQWWSNQASTVPKHVHIVEEGIEVFKAYEWSSDDMGAKRMDVALWLSNKYSGRGKNSFLFKNYINGILSEIDQDYNKQFCQQIAYTDRW